LGKEQSERAAGNKDIILKFKALSIPSTYSAIKHSCLRVKIKKLNENYFSRSLPV
jgi:hypothetical protein